MSATGHLRERYGYDAYGRPTFLSGAFSTEHASIVDWETLYSGYRFDEDTCLYNVRNRTYHHLLGLWIQRDPLASELMPNMYCYVNDAPVNAIDPHGTLSLWRRYAALAETGTGCGDLHYIDWDFALAKKAPCAGYFVQEILVVFIDSLCESCPTLADAFKTPWTHFWEAWEVKKDEQMWDLRLRARGRFPKWGFTDRFYVKHFRGTCGVKIAFGTVKFFCRDPLPGGGPSTGDLGRAGEAPRDPRSKWGPGKVPDSGILPSTYDRPDWWSKSPVEGPRSHFMVNWWCCCPGKKPGNVSFGAPMASLWRFGGF